MGKSQREKGKRGERMFRDVLRAAGFDPEHTYRTQQYSGKAADGTSSDVTCRQLPSLYWEVKNVERLNLWSAFAQASSDCPDGRMPIVAHTRNHHPFLVTLKAEDFLEIVRRSDIIEEVK